MLNGCKAGIVFQPQQLRAAEQALLHHHATDPQMVNQCRMQQIAQQAAMAAVNTMQNGGGGGWQQQGRQQNGRPAGAPQTKPCCRCGSLQHHQNQCSKRTDGSVCQKCKKPGHTAKMCKTKAPSPSSADGPCKCCGNPDHEKKDCQFKDTVCGACNKKGHTIHICRNAPQANTSQGVPPTYAQVAGAPPPPPKQTFMRDGKPAVPTPPKAVAAGDTMWTYRCHGCTLGIRDPDLVATTCPHQGCKIGDPRSQVPKQKAATSSFTCTKNAIETERRVAVAGPGGDLPPTQEHQALLDTVKQLEEQIEMLMKFSEEEMGDKLAEKRKELLKQKAKLPVQEVQDYRDPVAMYSCLAELETKFQKEKGQLEEKIAKSIEMREEASRNNVLEKKALDDMIIEQKLMLDNVRDTAIKKHEDMGKDLRDQLAELTTKVDERKAAIQSKLPSPPATAPTTATSAAPPSATGAVTIEVAPGSILHSNQLDPADVNACLSQMGMSGEQAALTSQAVFQLLNLLAMKVAPSPQTTPAAVAAGSQQTAAVKEVVQVEGERQEEHQEEDVGFTDGSTDTAAETAAANDNKPYAKIRKRRTKEERDAKSGKPAPQGKGGSKNAAKDQTKVKR